MKDPDAHHSPDSAPGPREKRPARSRRRRPRRRKREAAPAGENGVEAQTTRIAGELRDVFYRLLETKKALAGERFRSPGTTLKLNLRLDPSTELDPGGQLLAQIRQAVDRCVDEHSLFPFGHVYCHWCQTYQCQHSLPPDPRHVFRGYTATGQPIWQEFVSILLEKRHPRVDAIFGPEPAPVALVQEGHELSIDQLAEYGKRSPVFKILGQVALGYLIFPDSFTSLVEPLTQRVPVAMTFQAVVPGGGAKPPVLNILGNLPDGQQVFHLLEEVTDIRFSDALRSARRSLGELALIQEGKKRRQREGERRRRTIGVLTRLARNLERIFRQRSRRTQHSRDRHENRQRPASTALRDALAAAEESIFRDVEEQTWVIVGPRNRVHVFNDRALHITSVTYPGETVRQRTTRGKWRPPRREELEQFRKALAKRAEG